jgi:hypothetical protein
LLIQENFEKNINILINQAASEFQSKLLSNLVISKTFLKPFLEPAELDLENLAGHVTSLFRDHRDIQKLRVKFSGGD